MELRGSQPRTHIWMLCQHMRLQCNPNRAMETAGVAIACRSGLQKVSWLRSGIVASTQAG